MIFTDRTIIVQKGTSSINDTIVLYRGDREVQIRFSLKEGSPFKFGSGASPNIIEKTEATYGQLVIKTPGNLPPIFSEVAPTIGGKIIFTITAEMIDEITEVGNYTFQIRLLDDSMESRATLPEVKNGIEIREPIATEDVTDTNEVGIATVGYALTTAGVSEDTFDTQGNYNKTTWGTGDRITAAKLNKIEAGIDGVNKKVASGGTGSTGGDVDLSNYVTKDTGNANQITFSDGKTFQEKLDAGELKGNKGDTGEQGPQGIQGPKGDTGAKGEKGEDGLTTAISVNGNTYTHVNGTITLPDYPTSTGDSHTHSNKDVLDSITSTKVSNWDSAIPFNNSVATDANTWLTNGYIRTGADTANLPSVLSTYEKYGILFFLAENSANGTGTQMFFPIDGSYRGKIFTRSLAAMNTIQQVGEWYMLSTFDGNYDSLTNKPTIPSLDGYASETYVNNKIAEAQLGTDTGYTGTLVCDNFSVDIDYGIDETSDYTTIKYKDYGVLYLPTDYAKDGKKTRLIIFCQGTGERIGATSNPINNHGWKYFLGKGFAVMDMNGMSSDWGSAMGFPVTNQHYCNKYVLQSYKKGYDYVMAKYPYLHKEVFVAGLSMGGGASTMITQSGIIPVIAQVGFCPAISVYKQHYMKPWGGTNQQITIAGQYGFDNWSTTTPSQSYFLENINKVVGYDNLMTNTFGLQTDKDTANNNYNNDEEYNAYCNLAKYFPVPLKIWHCTDDDTVLYRYSELFVKMVQNGGGKATLRNMGTGGHGGGWNKGSVTDTDIDGKNITTSIPFYEAVRFMLSFDNSNNNSSSGDITTATLSSISASYSQGDRVIYPSTDLVDLKIGLNVTGTYSDGTTQTLTDYTLSGNLTVGTSTITVTYKDKTCTFSVIVSAESSGGGDVVGGLQPALAYDFRTGSLNETTGNGTAAVLSNTGTEFTSNGLHLTADGLATITSDILGAYESYTFEMTFNIDKYTDYQIIATMNERMTPRSPNKFGVNTANSESNGKLNFQTASGDAYDDTNFNNVNYQTMTHYIFTYDLETNIKKVYMNGELLTTKTSNTGRQPETTGSINKLYLGDKYNDANYMGTTIGITNYYSNHVVTDEEASELYTKYSSN